MKLKLDDHCKFINGGSWSADEYADIGFPVLKVSNFNHDSISFNELSYLNENSFEKYRKNQLELNDIVIATVGSHPSLVNSAAGRCIVIKKNARGLLLNQNAVCIRTKASEVIDQKYLGFLCKTQLFQHFIQQRGKGAANQMRIPIGGLKSFEFDFPKIETQQKIASILTAYDDLIENNRRRIELLEEKTQLIYEEWFVRMKFPNFKSTTVNEETGLPIGWYEMNFGDFSEISKGKNITKQTIEEGTIPVIAGGLSPAYYHKYPNTRSPVITVSASGANAGFTKIHLEDIWASDCSYIDTNMTDFIFYIYCLLNYKKLEVFNLQKGTAQPHVYPKDIARIKIIVPDEEILILFESIVKDCYACIGNLIEQNKRLKEARDILLPRLMMGIIEV